MSDKPDYKRNDPKGWCGDPKRGAALGRRTLREEPKEYEGAIHIYPVQLDAGGYDVNGTYFGAGPPDLFWVANADHTIDYVTRAEDIDAAMRSARTAWPRAPFQPHLTQPIKVMCGCVACPNVNDGYICDSCGERVCEAHFDGFTNECDDCAHHE